MAKPDEAKPVTLAEIQRALLTKLRSKECNGQGALAIADRLTGTIDGRQGADDGNPGRVLGAPESSAED